MKKRLTKKETIIARPVKPARFDWVIYTSDGQAFPVLLFGILFLSFPFGVVLLILRLTGVIHF